MRRRFFRRARCRRSVPDRGAPGRQRQSRRQSRVPAESRTDPVRQSAAADAAPARPRIPDCVDTIHRSRDQVPVTAFLHRPANRRTGPRLRFGNRVGTKFLDHFFIFQKNSLHLKMANFSSLKRRSIFTSRKILREKLELHSTSKKSLNIAKMVEKRFELPTSTHDLSYEKIRLADCHKIPIFSDKSENPHARVTGVHKFLTFTPPSVPVDNREASHQEMKPL